MTATTPELPHGCAVVREVPSVDPSALVHPLWTRTFPWLIQGTTNRGTGPEPFDLGIFSDASHARAVLRSWDHLQRSSGCRRAVVAHQVHGAAVRVHGPGSPGLHLADPCDGHATCVPGVLLAVTTADCVPVSIVDSRRRAVALLHAGWRGVAASVLERGVAVLGERMGAATGDLHVHLGPAICGRCYEVGPEVFEGLGLPAPPAPSPVDLRAVLARRARHCGVPAGQITVSAHCTLCGDAGLFSHRRGDHARQAGYLGIRP
ncbi:MAG: polyphenol oxidase family protein [Longimicrobiales bacterium]|nr:polyphenol oxidase family protein [Longimicrobiales bacterium]